MRSSPCTRQIPTREGGSATMVQTVSEDGLVTDTYDFGNGVKLQLTIKDKPVVCMQLDTVPPTWVQLSVVELPGAGPGKSGFGPSINIVQSDENGMPRIPRVVLPAPVDLTGGCEMELVGRLVQAGRTAFNANGEFVPRRRSSSPATP